MENIEFNKFVFRQNTYCCFRSDINPETVSFPAILFPSVLNNDFCWFLNNSKCNFPMCLGLWQIGRKEGDFGRPKRLRQAWILGGIEVWNLDCVCMQIGTATNRLQIESHGYARIPFWSSQRTIFPNLLTYWSMQTLKKYILYKMLCI